MVSYLYLFSLRSLKCSWYEWLTLFLLQADHRPRALPGLLPFCGLPVARRPRALAWPFSLSSLLRHKDTLLTQFLVTPNSDHWGPKWVLKNDSLAADSLVPLQVDQNELDLFFSEKRSVLCHLFLNWSRGLGKTTLRSFPIFFLFYEVKFNILRRLHWNIHIKEHRFPYKAEKSNPF